MTRSNEKTKGSKTKYEPLKFANATEAKQFVLGIFKHISHSKTAEDLVKIFKTHKQGPHLAKDIEEKKYPRLDFKLTGSEIDDLKKAGFINEGLELSARVANGSVEANGQTAKLTALEKLLIAILWKNGDLGKERHVIAGIEGREHKEQHGTVFHAFGRYLSGVNPYILDQHTLRCFVVRESNADNTDQSAFERATSFKVINGNNEEHRGWVKAYTDFYQALEQTLDDRNAERAEKLEYFYWVDRLLFRTGKLLKAASR